ncbi:MAG: oxidoreductase, partial [bacterium]|nr:oxidoreductase [bacterium]
MGKGNVLRVLKGTVLSPELSHALGVLLPNFQLEYYQDKVDYHRSISRRIQSLHDSFLFLLKAYPLDPQFTYLTQHTLQLYAEECLGQCQLKKDESLTELHKELQKYTAKLINVMSIAWQWPRKRELKESIATLNEAEQYLLMSRGRPNIATLFPLQLADGTEHIMLLDESLPPHYEQWLAELKCIKSLSFPKTFTWFHALPHFQQAYFCNLISEKNTPLIILDDLNEFTERWNKIKTNSLNLSTDLMTIYKQMLPLPSWFHSLSATHQEMIKVLAEEPSQVDGALQRFKLFIKEGLNAAKCSDLATLVQVPQWYWALSPRQQYFLEYVLKHEDKLEDAVTFLSSRHRTLPVPANYAAHSLLKISNKFEISAYYDKRYRSSHISSRDTRTPGDDGNTFPEAVQQRHSDANFAKVTEFARADQPIMMQTLISPIHLLENVPAMLMEQLPELPPDLDLFKMARATVARSERNINTFQHNHPLNVAKLFYYTQANDPDSLLLCHKASQYLDEYPELQFLLDEYKRVLVSPMGSATFLDYDGRELFLISLEQLIILTLKGYSYGSCVSGKDRKAVELIHTDAMILYKDKYGQWPKYGSPKEHEERINFVSLITQIYLSRHQQEH